MRSRPAAMSAVALAAAALVRAASAALLPAESFALIGDDQARSEALFAEAGKVILHPRCVNCHQRGDRPRQGDAMRVHQPPVGRGDDGQGVAAMRCVSCHGNSNFVATASVTVPGHPLWQLAPRTMAWEGRTLAEVCRHLKNGERNGYRTVTQLVEHMAHDTLVGWSWSPGAGRAPAPGTQEQFGKLMKAWLASGAHCPAA